MLTISALLMQDRKVQVDERFGGVGVGVGAGAGGGASVGGFTSMDAHAGEKEQKEKLLEIKEILEGDESISEAFDSIIDAILLSQGCGGGGASERCEGGGGGGGREKCEEDRCELLCGKGGCHSLRSEALVCHGQANRCS
jgi:hypothetical protein